MRFLSNLAALLRSGAACFRAICVQPEADGTTIVTFRDAAGDLVFTYDSTNKRLSFWDGDTPSLETLRISRQGANNALIEAGAAAGSLVRFGAGSYGGTTWLDIGSGQIDVGRLLVTVGVSGSTDNTHDLGLSTIGWRRLYIGTDSSIDEQAGGVLVFRNSADTADQPPQLGAFTVAGLPAPGIAGRHAFATNGRKAGEGPGAGTGVAIYDDGTQWRRMSDDTTVAA